MRLRRIWAVTRRELQEILRDRLFFTLAFLIPPLLMAVFNFGLSLDVEDIPAAVVDRDNSRLSRELAARLASSERFVLKAPPRRLEDAAQLFARGELRAVLVIPEEFEERLLAGEETRVQILADGTYPFRAETIKGYLSGMVRDFESERRRAFRARAVGTAPERFTPPQPPVRLEIRRLYNQALESDWSLAAKLMMVILMIFPPLLTSLTVVRERERGSLTALRASRVSRLGLMAGKLAPYTAIAFGNAMVLWAMAVWGFGAPFKGDPVFFVAACLCFVAATTGMGLLVSVLAPSQAAAELITFVVTVVPAVQYSGVFVPLSSLGPGAQAVAHALPAMHFTDIVVGCFLKGQGWAMLWPQAAALASYAGVMLGASTLLFRKRAAS
ncbi:MAG: ABC transporter permease [Desulfovibrionaceae bacterium]